MENKEDVKPEEYSESASSGLLCDYHVYCFKCGSDENLVMAPQRNKLKQMVGWVFSCGYCFGQIKEKTLETKIT